MSDEQTLKAAITSLWHGHLGALETAGRGEYADRVWVVAVNPRLIGRIWQGPQ